MYFYISFLRPPPTRAPLSGPILITPQIANDLRTELLHGPQDLYYSWIPSECAPPSPTPTKFTKLTTWSETTAYKEIKVSAPYGVREGQAWSLVLSASDHPLSRAINLRSDTFGEKPFPVTSDPVLFTTSRSRSKPEKQERIERILGFIVLEPVQTVRNDTDGDAVFLTLREQTGFDLDKKIWDSGLGLSSWLLTQRPFHATEGPLTPLEKLNRLLFSTGKQTFIELGAGTGIVSLALGALRSQIPGRSVDSPDSIITTDLESAIPLLEHNISVNSSHFSASNLQTAVLDWDQEELPSCVTGYELNDAGSRVCRGADLVLMADVTYNSDSFPSLIRTLSNLTAVDWRGSKHDASAVKTDMERALRPPILMGYKERHPAERRLWDLALEVGITFNKITEMKGAGGAPVEIWLGEFD